MSNLNNQQIRTICLESGVENLGKSAARITMVEGTGWITHNDCDIIVVAGEAVEFEPTRHPILISLAHKNQPIVFTVTQPVTAASRIKPQNFLQSIYSILW